MLWVNRNGWYVIYGFDKTNKFCCLCHKIYSLHNYMWLTWSGYLTSSKAKTRH